MEPQPNFHPHRSECTLASAIPPTNLDGLHSVTEAGFDTVREPISGTTMNTLLAKHEKFTKVWKASETYRELHEFLTEVLCNIDKFQIKSCMCLCLGSLTADWPRVGGWDREEEWGDSYTTSLSQLVAFESWIELLKSKHPIEQMFMQDPKFNDLDIEFLELRGFTVIESPASDNYMSQDTFLFTPGGEQDPVVSAIGAAYPALYIGNDLRDHHYITVNPDLFTGGYKPTLQEQIMNSLPAVAPLQRQTVLPFMNQRILKPMPRSDLATWLEGEIMYYKPASESELVPVTFSKSDEELYDDEQAEAYWRQQRGRAEEENGASMEIPGTVQH